MGWSCLLQLVIGILSLMLPLRVEIIAHIWWSLLLCCGTSEYRYPGILLCWIGEVALFACFFFFFCNARSTSQFQICLYEVDRISLPFMCQACSSDNYHQHVGALDAINEQRLPKVSEGNICIRSLFIKISSAKNGNLICIPWCMHFISAFFQLVFR